MLYVCACVRESLCVCDAINSFSFQPKTQSSFDFAIHCILSFRWNVPRIRNRARDSASQPLAFGSLPLASDASLMVEIKPHNHDRYNQVFLYCPCALGFLSERNIRSTLPPQEQLGRYVCLARIRYPSTRQQCTGRCITTPSPRQIPRGLESAPTVSRTQVRGEKLAPAQGARAPPAKRQSGRRCARTWDKMGRK